MNNELEPYQQRVLVERDELQQKIRNLYRFISGGSDAYRALPLMEKERLHLQRYLMQKYADVLSDRIDYFQEV